jgi:hypothetical protein
MFDRIKKAFSKDARRADADVPSSQMATRGPVSEWAATQGFTFSAEGSGQTFSVQGKVGGKSWRMEVGRPSRNYIRGEELRARAELGINDDAAVLVMNRPLKESLEKKAYSIYTDSLQTMADPNLPEEMRWLAMYNEVGWDSLPREFWTRYSVLADTRENALAWIDPSLAAQLMQWPEPGPSAEVPFMILLLRGKAYLRMEYEPADVPTLEHATAIFISACEAAMGGLAVALASK